MGGGGFEISVIVFNYKGKIVLVYLEVGIKGFFIYILFFIIFKELINVFFLRFLFYYFYFVCVSWELNL